MVAVDIYALDTELIPQPIAGVVLNVYDTNGVLQGSATTDVNGLGAFLLTGAASPTGVTYEVRAFKLGVIFSNPSQIVVFDPLPPLTFNNFNITGTLLTLDVATDPTLCRCTGRLMDFGNQPVKHALIRIAANVALYHEDPRNGQGLQNPKIVNGNLISPDAQDYYTDENGFVKIDLFRTGHYWVQFSGEIDAVWNILVPDRSSVNLIDLMFPQPVSVTWDPTIAPGNAVVIHVGELLAVPFTALFSDFETNPPSLGKWIEFSQDVPGIGSLGFLTTPGNQKVYLTGLQPGTFNVTPELLPCLTPYRVPTYSLVETPLAVTVVP